MITKVPFVDLQAQYQSIKTEIDEAIARVIADTAFISGPYARKFEEEFAEWLGVAECVSCGNGTDAIEILLQACGIEPGDEVLVPASSWIATSEAVSSIGAVPIFVDIDPQHYTLDPARIEEKITDKTRAIIPVHLYGLPADMTQIMQLAQAHHLTVIEDCAQAHGATWEGQKVGTFGHAATFSFYPGKNLGAYGDAGCMVSADPEICQQARMIANHGQLPGKKHTHLREGRNSRLDGLQAAILSAKLPYLDRWTALRQQHAATYNDQLATLPLQLPQVPLQATHVYHLFVVQVPARDEVRAQLKIAGIQTGVHYPTPLPYLDAYAHLNAQPEDFPVVYKAQHRILSLPIYPELTPQMIQYVTQQLSEIIKSV